MGKVAVSVKARHEKAVKERLGKLFQKLNAVRNADDLLILSPQVNKGHRIRLATQYLTVDLEKTIVVGDGENDADQYLNPGYKAALSNSHPRLKRLSNETMPYKSRKGILEIVKRLSR